ncbi:creatine transporter-like [Salvelinus sp. IW2-2015]|uniref:creatine transporter-like n=1 Tax=Salvelinus sp. IW2-2015 TaxID=2691554 RepID=UPI0038D38468
MDDVARMIGYRPMPYIEVVLVLHHAPVCVGVFLFHVVNYKPLTYNSMYTYPLWGEALGWCLALSSMLCIPISGPLQTTALQRILHRALAAPDHSGVGSTSHGVLGS